MTSCECIVFCLSPSLSLLLSLFRGAVHQHIGVQLPDPGERGGCASHLRCRNSAPRERAYICVPLKLRLRLKLHPTVDPSPTQKSVRGGSLGDSWGSCSLLLFFSFACMRNLRYISAPLLYRGKVVGQYQKNFSEMHFLPSRNFTRCQSVGKMTASQVKPNTNGCKWSPVCRISPQSTRSSPTKCWDRASSASCTEVRLAAAEPPGFLFHLELFRFEKRVRLLIQANTERAAETSPSRSSTR